MYNTEIHGKVGLGEVSPKDLKILEEELEINRDTVAEDKARMQSFQKNLKRFETMHNMKELKLK